MCSEKHMYATFVGSHILSTLTRSNMLIMSFKTSTTLDIVLLVYSSTENIGYIQSPMMIQDLSISFVSLEFFLTYSEDPNVH